MCLTRRFRKTNHTLSRDRISMRGGANADLCWSSAALQYSTAQFYRQEGGRESRPPEIIQSQHKKTHLTSEGRALSVTHLLNGLYFKMCTLAVGYWVISHDDAPAETVLILKKMPVTRWDIGYLPMTCRSVNSRCETWEKVTPTHSRHSLGSAVTGGSLLHVWLTVAQERCVCRCCRT